MNLLYLSTVLPLLLPFAVQAQPTYSSSVPVISTTSGHLHGRSFSSEVRGYLGIPYALPPTGTRRFAPPEPILDGASYVDKQVNATAYGPSCVQFPGAFDISNIPIDLSVKSESEDCLSLNVWVPTGGKKVAKNSDKGMPVMVFIYGGGFTIGSSDTDLYDPVRLVQDAKDVIVVTINYRLGLFGFPYTSAIPKALTNPGLLDQRAALRWLQANLHHFGGSAKKITLFGESAGSISIDYMRYGYPNDPIARGFIMQSGQVDLIPGDMNPFASEPLEPGADWKKIAEKAGCWKDDKDDELRCLKEKSWKDLKDISLELKVSGGVPHVDGVAVLGKSGFAKRAKAGKFSKLPVIIGSNDNEGDGLGFVIPPTNGTAVNYTASDAATEQSFTCPAARAARSAAAAGVSAFRYRWMPRFPSSLFLPWLRAYHGAELLWVFGTYATIPTNTTITEEEKKNELEAEKWVHKAWSAFAKDPTSGLKEVGWKKYDPNGKTLAELFKNNVPEMKLVESGKYDKNCAAY